MKLIRINSGIPTLLFSAALLMLASGFIPASQPVDDGNIKWLKVTHDFGAIAQNKPVTAEFRFVNISKDPVVITRVIASCGCTVPKYDELPILPGKEGVIRTTFDAETKGVFHKKISVLMDVGTYEIFIKGIVTDN
jgi:hypothetical protein